MPKPSVPSASGGAFAGVLQTWNQQSLQRKATFAAVALGVVPAFLVGVVAFVQSRGSVRDQIIETQESLLLELTQEVGIYARDRISEARSLAASPLLTNPRLSEIATTQEKVAMLNTFIDTKGDYDSVVVFDLAGNPLFQSKSPRPFRGNLKGTPFFDNAIATQDISVKDPTVSESSGRVSIEMAVPIKQNVTGETIGILRTRLPSNSLEDIFEHVEEEGYEFGLINNSGKFFIAEEDDLIGQDSGAEVVELADLRQKVQVHYHGEALGDESDRGNEAGADGLLDVITLVGAKDVTDGDRVVVSYAAVEESRSTADDLGWGMFLSQAQNEAFAPARNLGLILGTTILPVALGVAGIALFLSRKAIRPVLAAASTVDKIGRGDLDARLQIKGSDELAMLGNNVNEMASRLEVLVKEQSSSVEQAGLLADVTGAAVFTEEQRQEVFAKTLGDARQLLKCDRMVIYRFNQDFSGYISNENVGAGWPRALDDEIADACIPDQLLDA
ncbi:MAG: HAMP domain-containing protein, partial [Cyanobacteria bacterium J06639_1]